MASSDDSAALVMRAWGELERMEDLINLLPAAAGIDQDRRASFEARIGERKTWALKFSKGAKGFEDWQDKAESADQLVDEIVSLVIAALLRAQRIDMTPFDAGELLLDHLIERSGVPAVILGQTQRLESMDHTRATVSMRFPGSRIWELPFLAHEFGHHATRHLRHREPALRDRRPLVEAMNDVARTMRATRPPNPYAESHAGEQVADCVATIVCGPTFPIACLCLRVPNSSNSGRASSTHPSWQERIATMRETLDALADATGLERYRQQRESVVDPLATAVLGSLPSLTAAGRQAAQRSVSAITQHRLGLVYQDADAAIDIHERLTRQDPAAPPGTSVPAVIDGAWRWRMSSHNDRDRDRQVAALAVEYCRQVMSKPSRQGPTGDG